MPARVENTQTAAWLGAFAGGAIINLLFAVAGGAAGAVAVPAAGVLVEAAGAAAVGDGESSGHAGATTLMVRLACHLTVGTREDLEWLLLDGNYVKAHQHSTGGSRGQSGGGLVRTHFQVSGKPNHPGGGSGVAR